MGILFLLLAIVGFIFIAAILKSPSSKGNIGEKTVRVFISLRLDKENYRRIDDVTLEQSGETTQIDHVIVSEYGVFVIETKNMKGWIFGDETKAQWTQVIFKKSSKFQNPLHQNYKHVKALQTLLTLPPKEIHSVVVFVGESEFKTPMPNNVTHLSGLTTYIKSFTSPILTKKQVEGIVEKIEQARLPPTNETTRRHIENLRTRSSKAEASQDCPKCGASLVLRTSKSGAQAGIQFIGCSGYPRCRYSRAIK